jgi:glucose/mannose-6-phosphate isomerase
MTPKVLEGIMASLDDPMIYRQIDSSGMLSHLHNFPEQCQLAWEKIMRFDLPPEYKGIDRVIILGMGGSAIGGDVVHRLALAESKAPVWVYRDYGLLPFIDENTLVIASSYSGDTEETVSAFTQSLKTKAKKSGAIFLRGGGLTLVPRMTFCWQTRLCVIIHQLANQPQTEYNTAKW